LVDRKNRKALSHKLAAVGYEVVRNDAAKDGMWVVSGARKTIYARKSLTVPERIKAARELVARVPKTDYAKQAEQLDSSQRSARLNKAFGD
jgi:hypothetical protein